MSSRGLWPASAVAGLLLVAGLGGAPSSQIADAAKHRDLSALKTLLAAHADVNAALGDGSTALQWAAHWDDREAVDLLLRAGAHPDAANQLGVTPLALACINGSAAIVTRLVDAGAHASVASADGETPLMTCARSGSAEAVRALLAHGAEVNAKEHSQDQTALMWAAAEKHPQVVSLLLARGADVHARSRVTKQFVIREENGGRLVCPAPAGITARCTEAQTIESGSSTPLLFAARSGDPESAKLLLDAGAGTEETAPDGNAALAIAAMSGNTAVAKLLLERGAKPDADGGGYTALHAAVLRDDEELVKALIAHRADPNARVTRGTPIRRSAQDYILPGSLVGATPFFLAAKFIETDIMKALRDAGADPKLPAHDGTTPLMAAAGVGWKAGETRRGAAYAMVPPPDGERALEAVKIALEMGADVRAANGDGETALHGAATEGYADIARLLIDKGADINARTRRRETPLALSSAALLAAGGSYGVRDRRSVRALLLRLGAVEDAPRSAPRNLKVIKDPGQVQSVMAAFSTGLGVQCAYCHAQDRASDENPHKLTARAMLQMTTELNGKYFAAAERVSCYTCHRGESAPKAAPAAQ